MHVLKSIKLDMVPRWTGRTRQKCQTEPVFVSGESRVVGMGWIREPMVSTETGLRPEIMLYRLRHRVWKGWIGSRDLSGI